MKPLQLKMTAFGPYKSTETIDFNELQNNHLFVISGATGAGKTTIFDGICFALYGLGSGEDRRDTKIMRSDFATDDTHTSVELTFEMHQRTYRILRQLPHVKKGNKSATGERYEFFEVNETVEVPVVDRQIVSEINKKVEDIIGLTQDQFSQIVMLPQGEFRKLLTSQTENKEAILRKIFKTEPYKMISEKLKEKKLLAEAELKKEELARNSYTEQIVASFPTRDSSIFQLIDSGNFNIVQLVEALKEEINYYEKKVQLDETIYREACEKHANKQNDYYEAKAVNDRFVELEAKEQSLKNLQNQSEEYADKQYRLEAAERASSIEHMETYFRDSEQEVDKKSKLLELAKLEILEAEENVKQVEIEYTLEANKKEEREKSVEALIRLNSFMPLLEELESKGNEILNYQNRMNELSGQVTAMTNLFLEEKEVFASLKKEIEKLEALVEPLDYEVQRLTKLQTNNSMLQDFIKGEQLFLDLTKEENIQKQLFLDLQEAYKEEESKWLSNQASTLASKLVEGEACPVCGSTEHKVLRTEVHDEAVNQDELQNLKDQLGKQESQFWTVRAKRETAEENYLKMQKQLEELQLTIPEAPKLAKDVELLELEIVSLRQEKEKLAVLRNPYKASVQKVEKLEQDKISAEVTYQQQKGMYEQAKAVYDSKKASIPSYISNLQELTEQIKEATKYKEQLENSWAQIQNQKQLAVEAFTKAQLAVGHASNSLHEAKEKRDKANVQMNEGLAKAGFETIELYTVAKLSESERQILRDQCNAYTQALHTFTEQVKESREQLANKIKVELAPLEEELVTLKIAYEEALNILNSSKEYAKAGLEIEQKINTASSRITKLEQQLGRIVDLYDVLRGQNQSKVSFERYVLIEYLEQIVQAANERLKHLSGGQYYLIRSERQETHGKQSGLGLDVYDAYTGQTRDVKTLSGGEKFNASLCLALGMADIIQSFQGSIRIDTMFIDEGFGSLDEESLNKAIDTLIDLQKSGRMIGVISHVAELKAAIPAILEVEKLKEGYSRTRFVIK
ncbi:AAA family ATPase [Psychrobacillus sp. FJAT-21963]|uniref:AAA family ATPase n=1 Tax=Psychrobacillus sp. FJAT-21963 TaxID=1712028 RepID=UPI0006F5C0BE|nr:SMC family ATPase [Psychrobacillus sp. FJAT-21963]KQL37520.1 exonuclease [Psychrobacillus sp. FJAT-21963]